MNAFRRLVLLVLISVPCFGGEVEDAISKQAEDTVLKGVNEWLEGLGEDVEPTPPPMPIDKKPLINRINDLYMKWGDSSVHRKLYERHDMLLALAIAVLTDETNPKDDRQRFLNVLRKYSWRYDLNKADPWLAGRIVAVLAETFDKSDADIQEKYLDIFSSWQSDKFLLLVNKTLENAKDIYLLDAAISAARTNHDDKTRARLKWFALSEDEHLSPRAFMVLRDIEERAVLEEIAAKRPKLKPLLDAKIILGLPPLPMKPSPQATEPGAAK